MAGGLAGNIYSAVVDVFDADTGSWSTGQPLSQARTALAATTVGTKALFAGGVGNSGHSTIVDIYDASLGPPADAGTWSTATLSQGRYFLAATTVGTKAILAGGYASTGVSAAVDIYDASLGPPTDAGTWSTATLSQARYFLAATTVGTKAIFAGGCVAGACSGPSAVVDIYDAALGPPADPATWSTATLSQARSPLAATTLGTEALFAGGVSNSGHSAIVDIYDASTGIWSTATLSQARAYLAAISVGETALFAGGLNASGLVSAVVDIAALPNPAAATATAGGATLTPTATPTPNSAEATATAGGATLTPTATPTATATPTLTPTASPAATTFTSELTTGWNLVSLALDQSPVLTARGLCQVLDAAAGVSGAAVELFRWERAGQKYVSHACAASLEFAPDFALELGESYWLRVGQDVGRRVDVCRLPGECAGEHHPGGLEPARFTFHSVGYDHRTGTMSEVGR